jgi:hypothetical protein
MDDQSDSQARAFDFWVGRWDIHQRILTPDGGWLEYPASTSVSRALGGLALVERWQGMVQFFWEGMVEPERMLGLSVRTYVTKRDAWSIYWMDSRNPVFGAPYVGRFQDGVGRFYRTWRADDGQRHGRIRFSDITANSVCWDLAVSSNPSDDWSEIWKMDMARSGS